MKIFIVALLIFALLTSFVFFNIYYLTETLGDLREALACIPLPAEDTKELSVQAQQLSALRTVWGEKSAYISLTVNHADLMEVECHFAAALGAAYAGTRDNYLVSLSQLDYALSHLTEMAQATVKNVIARALIPCYP